MMYGSLKKLNVPLRPLRIIFNSIPTPQPWFIQTELLSMKSSTLFNPPNGTLEEGGGTLSRRLTNYTTRIFFRFIISAQGTQCYSIIRLRNCVFLISIFVSMTPSLPWPLPMLLLIVTISLPYPFQRFSTEFIWSNVWCQETIHIFKDLSFI